MQFLNEKVSSRKPFGLSTNYNKWVDTSSPGSIKCYGSFGNTKFASMSNVSNPRLDINKWKVCVGKANGGAKVPGKDGRKSVITGVLIAEPNTVCTESFLVINSFDNETDASNFRQYTKTKFFRYMLGLRAYTQNITKNCFSWVPDMQDYSIVWTDEMLYEYFNLSTDEVKYIESKIK